MVACGKCFGEGFTFGAAFVKDEYGNRYYERIACECVTLTDTALANGEPIDALAYDRCHACGGTLAGERIASGWYVTADGFVICSLCGECDTCGGEGILFDAGDWIFDPTFNEWARESPPCGECIMGRIESLCDAALLDGYRL